MFSARLWRWAAAGALTPIGIAALLLGVLAIAAPVRADIRPVVQQASARFGKATALTRVGNTRILAVSQLTPPRVDIFTSDVSDAAGDDWSPEAGMTPSGPAVATFGHTLAIQAGPDGTVLLGIGGYSMQEVLLYRRSVGGIWSLEQVLPSSVLANTNGGFGNSIAISPDLRMVAVGSPETNQPPVAAVGAVAVFRRVGGTFQFSANVTQSVSVPAAGDAYIGMGVAFADLPSGQKPELLVGAVGLGTAGQVMVFRENTPGAWVRIKTLAPPERIGDIGFGASLKCSGSSAIVSQLYAGYGWGGTAWILRRNQGNWMIESELRRFGSLTYSSEYGHSVAISGDMAAVGTDSDFVHLFRRLGNGSWAFHDVVVAAPADVDGDIAGVGFGSVVALHDGLLVVSAPFFGLPPFSSVGNVSLIEVGATTLLTPDRSSYGYFGHAVAMSGNRCAISAPQAVTGFNGTTPLKKGSVRVMEFVDGVWREETVLRSEANDQGFGTAVAMPDADTVVVSEPGFIPFGGNPYGRVLIFRRFNDGFWDRTAYTHTAPSAGIAATNFGQSLAAVSIGSELLIAAGAPYESNGATSGTGGVVLIRVSASGLTSSTTLFAPTPTALEGFGTSVALERYPDGSVDLCVGAGQRSRNGVANVGALDLFRWRPGDAPYQFTYKQSFVPPGVDEGDIVGYLPNALSMRGSLLVVGVPIGETPPSVGQGFARAYRRSPNGTWTLLGGVMRGLNASSIDTASGVSTNGTLIAVSRPGNNEVALYRAVGSGVQYVRSVRRPSPVRNSFGSAIAMGAGLNPAMLIGAPTEDVGDLDWAGSAFYFGGAFGP